MTKSNPLISVIIINYNYATYVGEAIESVLNQTYKNIEFIIINDGSTDNSDKVIKKYLKENPNIIYINQKNQGANFSRNKGIELAKGKYIFLLDSDNWLSTDHLQKVYRTAVINNADVVYTDLRHFGDDNNIHVMPEFDINYLKITNFIDTASLIRKSAIGKNRFDIWLNRRFLQDYDFFLGLALKGCKIVKCKSTALHYRVHPRQNGNNQEDINKLEKSIEIYRYIINKYKKLYPEQFGLGVTCSNNIVIDNILLRISYIKLSKQNTELQIQIDGLINSLSWKMTKPLRWFHYVVRKISK